MNRRELLAEAEVAATKIRLLWADRHHPGTRARVHYLVRIIRLTRPRNTKETACSAT